VYGGTNVWTAGAAQTLRLGYIGTGGTTIITTALSNAAIVAASNQMAFSNITANAGVLDSAASAITNSAVVIFNSIATEISGNAAANNTMNVVVVYSIVTIP
jgi:hypothetical protein